MDTRNADTPPEEQFAAFIAELSFDDVPSDVVETVVRAFVDTTGVALAGTQTAVGQSTARASGEASLSPQEYALYAGTAAHALDYDDVSWGIDGHPSAVLVPSVLALATERSVDGRDAIAAYVAGFETACAIAAPISPNHYERGWHATATFGTFGAAAATAHLLDFNEDRTRAALGIAASTPAGLTRNFGTTTKPVHAGFAARSGVTATLLADEGITADPDAISGEGGFWELYGGQQKRLPTLPDEWFLRTEGIHVKTYPCCYFTHTSIAAAESLAERHGIEPESVESVTVTASRGAADTLRHRNPKTGIEAKFSMEYTVASGIVRERVDLDAFEDTAIDDPAVDDVRRRVTFTADPELPYDAHEATIRIETGDESYEQTRANPPGVHSDPPTESDQRKKFDECATRAVSEETAAQVFDDLRSLPGATDLEAVTTAVQP